MAKKEKKDRFSYLLDTPSENLPKMTGFLGYRAKDHIIVLDANIVDCPVEKELDSAHADQIQEISKYNANLANIIRNYASDRVIVTRDVREEMKTGLDAAGSRIKGTPKGDIKKQRALTELLDSYHKIEAQLTHNKRLADNYDSGGEIYAAFLNIVRKMVREIPGIKKDERVGDNETDEKLVAYAFAQAFKQDRKAIIFSLDCDVKKIVKNLYEILTCKNTLGNGKIGQKLKQCNIEVITYNSDTKLFAPSFVGNQVNGLWQPDVYGVDIEAIVHYAGQMLIPFESENGNGHAKKEMQEAEERKRRDTAPLPIVKQLDDFQRQRIVAACERIYRKLKINPEDLRLADAETVGDAIQTYNDMIVIYEDRGLPVEPLREELQKIEENSVAGKITKLEKESEALSAEVSELTKDHLKYLKDKDKRNKVRELNKQIDINLSTIESLEKKIQGAQTAASFDDLNDAEKQLCHDFAAEGYVITEQGVPIGIEALMKVTGRNKQAVHSLVSQLGKKKGIHIERVKGEKPDKGKAPVLYKITPDLIPYLLKKH